MYEHGRNITDAIERQEPFNFKLSAQKLQILLMDRSQNYAFFCIYLHYISFALHFICITFAFCIAPRIDIFALRLINISKFQINAK